MVEFVSGLIQHSLQAAPADELLGHTHPCRAQFSAGQSSRVCPGSSLAAHPPQNPSHLGPAASAPQLRFVRAELNIKTNL